MDCASCDYLGKPASISENEEGTVRNNSPYTEDRAGRQKKKKGEVKGEEGSLCSRQKKAGVIAIKHYIKEEQGETSA